MCSALRVRFIALCAYVTTSSSLWTLGSNDSGMEFVRDLVACFGNCNWHSYVRSFILRWELLRKFAIKHSWYCISVYSNMVWYFRTYVRKLIKHGISPSSIGATWLTNVSIHVASWGQRCSKRLRSVWLHKNTVKVFLGKVFGVQSHLALRVYFLWSTNDSYGWT